MYFLFGTFPNWVSEFQPKTQPCWLWRSSSCTSTQELPVVQFSWPQPSTAAAVPWGPRDGLPRSLLLLLPPDCQEGLECTAVVQSSPGPSQVSIFSLFLRAAQCPIIHFHLTCSPVSCLPRLSKPHHARHALHPHPLQSAQAPMGSLPRGCPSCHPSCHPPGVYLNILGPSPLLAAALQGRFLHPFPPPHDRAAPEFPPRSHCWPPPDSPPNTVRWPITQENFSRITVMRP